MHIETGNIISPELMKLLQEAPAESPAAAQQRMWKRMEIDPTPEQLSRGRVNRNEPCPCGSGKKFKRCCLRKTK